MKRVAQHQGVSGRSGAVIRRIHILRKEIPGEPPAGAEIGEARGVLRRGRIHGEERVFHAAGIAEPVGKQVHAQIVRLPDVQKRCGNKQPARNIDLHRGVRGYEAAVWRISAK